MKKKISLLLALVMVFSIMLVGCGKDQPQDTTKDPAENVETEDNSLDAIVESGKIVLGTSADYPPFEFHALVDGKDEFVGLDIEISKYIADELGVELEIKDMDFDKLLGGLSAGMLDMVVSGMNPTPKRLEGANFTDIYYDANLSVLITKESESEITKFEDLQGKKLGIQLGTTQEDIAKEIEGADVTSLSVNTDIIMNLKTKKIDATIMETPVAESFVKANDDLMVVEGLDIDNDSGGVAIATTKGNDKLTEKLNEILDKIKAEGLIEKWLVEADELSKDAL